jgi:hypothetical protein
MKLNLNKKIAIVGAGTAGIQAICHLIYFLKEFEITLIHNPNIPSVGIGESTNPTFISAIEKGLDFSIFNILEDKELDATLKLGTLYKKWRKHNFINPLLSGSAAIHFNTFKLYAYAIPRLKKIWKNKFKELNGTVNDIINNENYASVVLDKKEYMFDYVVDCRGFPKSYDNYTIVNNPTNHCIVYNQEGDYKLDKDPNNMVTSHTATKDGWMFTIPLTTRKSYGYLFNNKITKINIAKENFKKEINIKNKNFEIKEFIYKSYYSNNLIDKRIIKNGNRAVFFEPMFANSLWLYDGINRIIYDYIYNVKNVTDLNISFIKNAKAVEEMICYTYHGGSNYNTNFWKETKKYSINRLKTSFNLKKTKEILKNKNIVNDDYGWVYAKLALEIIDRNFEYNYFK